MSRETTPAGAQRLPVEDPVSRAALPLLRVRISRLGSVALMVLWTGACAQADARPPLANTRKSEKELIQSVLNAVTAKDEAQLASFLVSRDEYESHLWPEMPDKDYTPFNFVWSLNATNNRKGLRQLLEQYGGIPLEFVSIEYHEEPEVYQSFTLRPGASVTVRRKDTGQEGILPSFDVLVQYGGVWKLMNYDEL